MNQAIIAAAFVAACEDELQALKPGNVHVHADGHRMTVDDFRRSAAAASGPLTIPGARVGVRIAGAVAATLARVGTNTNLGIVLLCAPLAAAAERATSPLGTELARELAGLDREDAALAFKAIVSSAPAGLGRAERHDVFAPATVTLRAAMAEAAGRDRIARQYATDFADVFGLGLPVFRRALARWADRRWATLATYLKFLSAFPDSHIVRKHGEGVAEEARAAAEQVRGRLETCTSPEDLIPDLRDWDSHLKRCGINPGTSADLTVATLFADRLRNILPSTQRNG
ncbi:triphosphoribosyl-dephospho-CoA synthase [Xanthobacteraceae bacterium Astr-EGSB]|uniref:triphosphoribosyl-dephospho-CoA synthase n=1 Tax=Astrobacterium formosum TaxID=3069710 RepID=UPI0027B06662|nr:triphosphoribosyl-dephospho-CoA synthase [Xanthobacteraceae bacterium Astr-EGSB]